MNISYRKYLASGKVHTKSLVDFFVNDLNDNLTYDNDIDIVISAVETGLNNTNYMVAKVLDFLVEQGIMSPEYLIQNFLTDGKNIFDVELTREVNDNAK